VLVKEKKDLYRQIVKSEFASIKIPEIDLELPSKSGTGYLTTVEGLVKRILDDMKKSLDNPSIVILFIILF
jgi:zinc finger protein